MGRTLWTRYCVGAGNWDNTVNVLYNDALLTDKRHKNRKLETRTV